MVRCLVFAVFLLVGSLGAEGQDTRSVTEPRYPTICKVLYAQLSPINGTLPDEPIEKHYRDNDRIVKAMAGCAAGTSVVLHGAKTGRSIFLIGPLRLRAGITLVVDGSAAVWGSRDPRNYDVQPGSCGVLGTPGDTATRGPGCLPLILAEDAPHSGIMGDGVIDGRGGAKLLNQNETWWELAHRAKVEDTNQAVSRLLVVRRSNDFTLYRITLKNSPNCHVTTEATDGFTAWGVRIDTPKWARNTDGIDPQAGSTDLSIIQSWIRAGDDNISPKSNAAGAVSHMTVRDTHFYNGHGFGIGSQTSGGISHVLVAGLSIDGSDNGLRIKSDRSRGGLVEDVQFQNVCMRNTPNPIVLNPFYTTFEGTKIPVYRGISLQNVHALTAGAITMRGLDAEHKLEASLSNVVVDGQKQEDVAASFATFTLRGGNLEPKGEDVSVHGGKAGGGSAFDCSRAFPEFPANVQATAPVSAEVIPPADTTFYVAADGTGDYYSVQAALNKVPASGGLVLVAPGVYRERLLVKAGQGHVTLKSANSDARKTVIVFDLSQGTKGLQQGSATVMVNGDNFTAENITFENDFNKTHPQEGPGTSAPALSLTGDRNVLRNVRILGNQGTLHITAKNCPQASSGSCDETRSYFSKCLIAGNVGFIAGDGTAYFDDCEIRSTPHQPGGFITAQGKHANTQHSLFVFRNCRMTADAGATNVLLGRPFRDLADVVFLNPTLDAHIKPVAWGEWTTGTTHRLETAFFRVYKPTGSGAPTTSLTLSAEEASRYTVREVLGGRDGWNPTP